jgi:hypothetical protein
MNRILMAICLILLCSCQNAQVEDPSTGTPFATFSAPGPVETPTQQDESQQAIASIQAVWAAGAHSTGNQVIGCKNCHDTSGGSIEAAIAWWNPQTLQYEHVTDGNDLCLKCHTGVGKPIPQAISGIAIHNNLGCIDCHDVHNIQASCTSSICHSNILQNNPAPPSTPTGGHPNVGSPFCGGPTSCHPAATEAASKPQSIHGWQHKIVSCEACHDAGNLPAGPVEDGSAWVTWQTIIQSGNPVTQPYFSHSIQVNVDCFRCHFSNNPWNLALVSGNEFK